MKYPARLFAILPLLVLLSAFTSLALSAKPTAITLSADGPGNTYELITSVLAPGYDPVEEPDCSHSAFGRHIDEIWDNDLSAYVFRFFIHTTPDNDRCINFDRQRNEIKTYDQSPDNLLGVAGETVTYQWRFKLDAAFQPSSSFTHLHQLKAVGGPDAWMPLFTLTPRKSSPDRLELRYAETGSSTILHQADLAPFKGTWLEVTETIAYGDVGTYAITITKVADGTVLFQYDNNAIKTWKTDAEFIRPKWGIYRSLNDSANLRDEVVLFADFSISESVPTAVSDRSQLATNSAETLYPLVLPILLTLIFVSVLINASTKAEPHPRQ